MNELSEAAIEAIAVRAAAATPGPWHVAHLDDEHAMSLIAVSTSSEQPSDSRWPDFDHKTLVAATLVQQPRYVDHAGERWEADANFIAHARQDIPVLLDEIRRLREVVADRRT